MTGIGEKETVEVAEYHNPTSDILNIKINGNTRNARLVVNNMLGATVRTEAVNSDRIRLDVSNLPNGVYFYSIVGENDILVTRRFVVSK